MTPEEEKAAVVDWEAFRASMSPQTVVLTSCSTARQPVDQPETTQINQAITVDHVQFIDGGGVAVQITSRLDLVSPPDSSNVACIESTWVLGYSSAQGNHAFSQPVQQMAVFHLWPYVREFATSMSLRMGLQPLLLPMMTIEEIVTGLRDGQPNTPDESDSSASQ